MDRLETTALLRRAKSGSDEALNSLFERYGGKLLALIRVRMGRDLRGQLESRDVLQAALFKAFRHIDQLERSDGASLMAWLARIAENEIRDRVDYHRRQRRDAAKEVDRTEGLEQIAEQVATLSSRLVLREETERVARALLTLDEAQREVVLLRRFEELSFKEIADRMGRSPDACRMLLARALTALALRMRDSE